MLLSVLIVNWNTVGPLRDCLQSLSDNPPQDAKMEVITVDNASADGSAEMVRAAFPAVQLLTPGANLGYAEGNNLAASHARGDYLLLLNPDVCVHAHALTNALAFAAAHPQAGAIGARLVGTGGETQRTLRGFPDPLPVLCEYVGLSRLFPRSRFCGAYRQTYFDYDQPGETDQPMASFLLIPRPVWNEVGPMDEQFPIFFNDVDWCWRAKRDAGFEVWYTPDAAATHLGGASTKQIRPQMIRESHRSLLRFYDKHYKGRVSPLLYFAITQAVLWNERRLLKLARRAAV